MDDPEIAALFALADEAREAMQVGAELAQLCPNDVDGGKMHASRTGQVVYSFDWRGDVHACFGMQCRHVRLGQENHYVCGVSGRVVGVEHTGDPDPGWTGRSRTSANPDDTAGTPVGGWMKRRDMYAASVAAYKMAGQLSDAEIQPMAAAATATAAASTPAVKRGALCVDEVPDANAAPKKARSLRKENWSREAIDKLAKEAIGVIDKLFIAAPKAQQPSGSQPDPRLQNLEFVKAAAIRKYVKRCVDGESELNLDVLNNVVVHANAFVREQRAAAAAWRDAAAAASSASARNSRTDAVFSGQIRNQLSQLIVSLWRASCLTKHFQSAKKGSDSFKPFAAGILYSLKRGLYLDDGTCVVPVLEDLAAHLPALRSASSTPAAKQLQSSSHRGICSIQRALTSIAEMNSEEALPARTLLRDAARQGAFLRELVSRNS
jgi:hypothetical protein